MIDDRPARPARQARSARTSRQPNLERTRFRAVEPSFDRPTLARTGEAVGHRQRGVAIRRVEVEHGRGGVAAANSAHLHPARAGFQQLAEPPRFGLGRRLAAMDDHDFDRRSGRAPRRRRAPGPPGSGERGAQPPASPASAGPEAGRFRRGEWMRAVPQWAGTPPARCQGPWGTGAKRRRAEKLAAAGPQTDRTSVGRAEERRPRPEQGTPVREQSIRGLAGWEQPGRAQPAAARRERACPAAVHRGSVGRRLPGSLAACGTGLEAAPSRPLPVAAAGAAGSGPRSCGSRVDRASPRRGQRRSRAGSAGARTRTGRTWAAASWAAARTPQQMQPVAGSASSSSTCAGPGAARGAGRGAAAGRGGAAAWARPARTARPVGEPPAPRAGARPAAAVLAQRRAAAELRAPSAAPASPAAARSAGTTTSRRRTDGLPPRPAARCSQRAHSTAHRLRTKAGDGANDRPVALNLCGWAGELVEVGRVEAGSPLQPLPVQRQEGRPAQLDQSIAAQCLNGAVHVNRG